MLSERGDVLAEVAVDLAAKVGAGALIDRDEGAHQNREDDDRDRDREPCPGARPAEPAPEPVKHWPEGGTPPT